MADPVFLLFFFYGSFFLGLFLVLAIGFYVVLFLTRSGPVAALPDSNDSLPGPYRMKIGRYRDL
jgi:hypothetical protein